MNNLVSVIIPCYNYGHFLEECVNSVISNSTSADVEIIIVDDCSTDNSFLIAKGLESKYNNCRVLHNDTNKKLSYTRNRGIKESNGDLIVCLDADDLIPDNYIQANLNTINEGADISYSNTQCFGITKKIYDWPDFDINILRKSNFIHCASMFRKIVWETVGGFDESFIYGLEDYDFWLSAAKLGFKFKKNKETYLLYMTSFKSLTETISCKYTDYIKREIKKKHKDFYLGI